MPKVIDNLASSIKDQINQEYKRVHKKFDFIKKLTKVDHTNNDKFFRDVFGCICDKDKEVNCTITSQSVDMIFKDGKFLVDNQEVKNLFGASVYIKNNIVTLDSCDVVLDLNLLESIAFDKPTFKKCLKFMEEYSELLRSLDIINEAKETVISYLQSLKKFQLNNEIDINSIDPIKLKKDITKFNKDYNKFVTKFNTFASPYNLMIAL